jgi:hypothetical protein
MSIERPSSEQEPVYRDISQEFETMSERDFRRFIDGLVDEGVPALEITTTYKDIWQARALKEFKDFPRGQKRKVTLRATRKQHSQAINEFSCGLIWEEIDGEPLSKTEK